MYEDFMSTNTQTETASLQLPDQTIELPIIVGTEKEHGVDISKLRGQTSYITSDDGYGNTGSCSSKICFINGEKGILRYRGIPIEQVAEHATFVETVWLLIFGELPTKDQLDSFSAQLTEHQMLHEGVLKHFAGFPSGAQPMAKLSAMINAISCYHPDVMNVDADEEAFTTIAAKLISKVRTVAAMGYQHSIGQPMIYPKPGLDYCSNFLHMMFSQPNSDYELDPDIVRALNQIFILHADHEQNCSTSTVRMVGSSRSNLFASCSAGVGALWGPLHGGANVAVLDMLGHIADNNIDMKDYVERVKKKEVKLMGFGHRVYKNFDPRATILKKAADKILPNLGVKDPLLDMARRMEEIALEDSYFKDRNLYPNVDFYSGIIMRAMGIPVDMFTVLFSIGRMPGWIAHWKELHDDPKARIYRPRQIYTGCTDRDYVPMEKR
jgi:citrate synthase